MMMTVGMVRGLDTALQGAVRGFNLEGFVMGNGRSSNLTITSRHLDTPPLVETPVLGSSDYF